MFVTFSFRKRGKMIQNYVDLVEVVKEIARTLINYL